MAGQEMFDDVLMVLKCHYEERGFKEGVSKIEALEASSKALKFSIAVIGEQDSGKTTLLNALRDHEEPYNESQLASFFSTATKTLEPVGHVYPTFPNTMLWDLPGYDPAEQPVQYLKVIDFQKYNILVLCVAGPLTENHLQLLKAIKQKGKVWYVVRMQVDLDVHTCKRRLRAGYALRDTLQELRKGCTEGLEKAGLGSERVFLVSGLEREKYDFAQLEDSLEKDILSFRRNVDWDVAGFKPWSQERLQEFYAVCDTGGLADLPVLIQSALDMPVNIRLDIAVTGEVGSGKSAFINALRDLTLDEGDEAVTGVTDTTRKPTAFPHLEIPNVYIWDLPGFGTLELPMDLYLKHLELDRYDFFIIVASERYKHAHSSLVRAISALGKKFFFVRSKIDSDLEASQKQRTRPATPDVIKLQEKVKQGYLDALKKEVDKPEVFLVSSLDSHKFEMPQLRAALQKEIPILKQQVLLRSISAIIFQMVRWKRKALVKNACGKALQTCLYAIEKPDPEAIVQLASTLSDYVADFGLDEEGLQRMAQATGKKVEDLRAEIRCPLVKAIDCDQILKQVSRSVASWGWSYMPPWRHSNHASISLDLTYNLVKSTVWDMSEDAERVLRKAYTTN